MSAAASPTLPLSPPLFLLLDDREGLIRRSPGFDRIQELLGSAACAVLDAPLSTLPAETIASFASVKFVLAVRERTAVDEPFLSLLPCLELVLQTGGHAYHVNAPALRERGVVCALGRRAKQVLAAVPELTMMLMLACAHRLGEATRALSLPGAAGAAKPPAGAGWPSLVGRCLNGRRLGILGYGRHGRNVAKLARAFGMSVVAWSRESDQPQRGDEDDVPRLRLEELLATCDVVSVHLRLSAESRGLLDASRLRSMKRGAILINTARGAIVDEGALAELLASGHLGACGLDVFVEEPLPLGSPLRSLPNAVLSPHVGWTTEEVFCEFADIAAEQLVAYLGGRLSEEELLDAGVMPRKDACGDIARTSGVSGDCGAH